MSLAIYKCQRCGHEWASHKEQWEKYGGKPLQCPKCKSAKWFEKKEIKKK